MNGNRTTTHRINAAARRATVQALLWTSLAALPASTVSAQRVTIPLNGSWAVGDSVDPNIPPSAFDHTVAVPGLVHSAKPAFAGVDQYETQEWIGTMIRDGIFPATEAIQTLGRTQQPRMYFWYRRSFRAPARKQRALLVVNKAQFGTAVWLNGKKVGEHPGCFTAGRFDITDAIHWNDDNQILIRIGAHPGALPPTVIYGGDGEKEFWTPGIYDDVSVVVSDAPAIESVQVAPRIESSEIVVETELTNVGPARPVILRQQVKAWKGGRAIGQPAVERFAMGAGESKVVRQTIRVPGAVLWSPDNPFLYTLDTATDGDNSTVRFGMRELHFDGQRAILNGQPIYLRGASITLHRFFADPDSGGLPWDDDWVQKFLVEIPKGMHWNAFRVCIGPAPQRWLDIADEGGILLQYEFPIWDDRKPLHQKLWDQGEILTEFKEYMRDNWNHPSLVLWDASNETHWSYLGDTVIPAVRTLDLSNRPWENGYNGPQGPGDPYEIHPYKFVNYFFRRGPHYFEMTDLEKPDDTKAQWPGHATIINEYGWLWLHRDGRPTVLTQKVYDHLLPNATADQRFLTYAYLLAGLTEYFRAFRKHAGVLYLAYLDGEGPHTYTADNFRDVRTLEFQPYFEDYMKEAFKPLGVYIDFWQPKLDAGVKRAFHVMMVNDTPQALSGKLTLVLESSVGGQAAARAETEFDIPAFGQGGYDIELAVPQVQGEFLLKAIADSGDAESPTLSRRKVTVAETP
jgi:beta-galactosidase